MSCLHEYIEKNPQETQRLVGLKFDSLQQLITQAEALHNQKQSSIEVNKTRLMALSQKVE
jgi:hypothetical protein